MDALRFCKPKSYTIVYVQIGVSINHSRTSQIWSEISSSVNMARLFHEPEVLDRKAICYLQTCSSCQYHQIWTIVAIIVKLIVGAV